MEYQVTVTIDNTSALCFKHYTEPEKIKKWLPQLKDVVSTERNLFDQGSKGYFVFDQNGHDMLMEIEVIATNHHEVTIDYRVPGAYNRCLNKFIEHEHKVIWTMDVIFLFDEDPNLSEEVFIQSTTSSMNVFKHYIEGLAK